MSPLKSLGKYCSFPLPSFWWLWYSSEILGLQVHHSSLCLHRQWTSFPCAHVYMSDSPSPSSYNDTSRWL